MTILVKKILIFGLPGSGKTTLAHSLSKDLPAVHWNGDDVRYNLGSHLTFSLKDRIIQAQRMSWLCDQVNITGVKAIADFVCPTEATRKIFNADFIIWVDRIKSGRYDDTNKLFEKPFNYNVRVIGDMPPEYWITRIKKIMNNSENL